MKLLVTGGAGFIGSNFIHYWLKNHKNDQIFNLDKLTYAGNLENLKDLEGDSRHQLVVGDITNVDVVRDLIKKVDVIVHFAAESHVDRSIIDAGEFVRTNVVGTQLLLQGAKDFDKRFHHVSTDEVYGQLPLEGTEKFSEATPYNPRNPYSASKAASDHLVRAFYYTHNCSVTISNCGNNFGPFQFPEKLIPLAITNILEGKKVPVYGDGKYVRDWLYVDDHCRAIELILTEGATGETYCIGGMTSGIRNLEVIKKILKILGQGEELIEFVKDRPGHDRRYEIDWGKAKRELQFEPQYDFDRYLQKTVEWYQANEVWWKNVKSGAYKEYYQKQYGGSQ
ncbi:MAG: dTDP-glucose 4,6-dehydratase [Candidatus Buchananbacteria bacterium RIFCSPHIGHO2_01_FULL_47_11b]|uniref:dTDP-glucose 4,6-dehydratase n=1 Tax=Candidatus Buchananbacteria bacterium RIFCSPHIGHO2_01_FULL_47_11b TaxID=1797537 RepID=A0A1G1Y5S2_9BACT|nr:MAG: dTDP-glucose 4,6-dehydratase [Candidatus Buchananbacteria bacterium RIFCSPHIGHO2_01_FULL_47_11b]